MSVPADPRSTSALGWGNGSEWRMHLAAALALDFIGHQLHAMPDAEFDAAEDRWAAGWAVLRERRAVRRDLLRTLRREAGKGV